MKKILGVQAEFNITADEDITKGIGKGLQNGTVVLSDIIKDVKPVAIQWLKEQLEKDSKKD